VKVASKGARRDGRIEITIGGGEHAQVDAGLLGRAHTPELAGLDDPQNAGLVVEAEVADFVQ